MNKYRCNIVRTASRFATIEVEAETVEGAKYKALDQAGGIDFPGEKEAEYQIDSIMDLSELNLHKKRKIR